MAVNISVGPRIGVILEGTTDTNGNVLAATGSIDGGHLSDTDADRLGQIIKSHIVAVDPAQPSCCIDGRVCIRTLNGSVTQPRPVVAGGALLTAYAAAELTGWFKTGSLNPAERMQQIAEVLRNSGIVLGNHCDELALQHAFHNPKDDTAITGCGADDRLPEILYKVYDEPVALNKLCAALLGDTYDADHEQYVDKSSLESILSSWNPAAVIAVINDGSAIEVLDSGSHEPNNGHEEVAVIFNYSPDTTVDRAALFEQIGLQVFDIDMWYIDKLSRALVAGSTATVPYERLRQAMVDYQVATYLTLCNGSQRIVFIR